MSGASDIVVLGSLHLDVLVQAPGLPRLGETMSGSAVAFRPGGKGGNQAVAAARHGARHGARVAMIGAIGDDASGVTLRAHLRAHGVDDAQVATHPGAASGMSVAISEPGGDYAAVIVSGANLRLGALPPDAVAALLGARVLVLQNEVPEAANLAAARVAHACGCRVILNAAPARTLPKELAALLDILVVNALEAEALCGVPVTDAASAQAAATALSRQMRCAIVTAGGNGVALAAGGTEIKSAAGGLGSMHIPAHAVRVLSTHGAGDAFVGALAARRAAGDALDAAGRYANAAAALLVSTPHPAGEQLGADAVSRMLAGAPAPGP